MKRVGRLSSDVHGSSSSTTATPVAAQQRWLPKPSGDFRETGRQAEEVLLPTGPGLLRGSSAVKRSLESERKLIGSKGTISRTASTQTVTQVTPSSPRSPRLVHRRLSSSPHHERRPADGAADSHVLPLRPPNRVLQPQRPASRVVGDGNQSDSDSSEEFSSRAMTRSQAFRRRPLFAQKRLGKRLGGGGTQQHAADAEGGQGEEDEDDDDEDDGPTFLPFSGREQQQQQHDTISNLRQIRRGQEVAAAAAAAGGEEEAAAIASVTATTQQIESASPTASSASSAQLVSPASASTKSSTAVANRQQQQQQQQQHPQQQAIGRPAAGRREGSEGGTGAPPSMGSSFSDLDDSSVTRSALEEALASDLRRGNNVASRMSSIGQALRGAGSRRP